MCVCACACVQVEHEPVADPGGGGSDDPPSDYKLQSYYPTELQVFKHFCTNAV